MTAPALRILKTAVAYALQKPNSKRHTLSIDCLRQMSDLPELSTLQLRALLSEARKALAIAELIDANSSDSEDWPSISWPVFDYIGSSACTISFEISRRTFDPKLLEVLWSLHTSGEKRML
jgi:hypothetical protein